MAYIFAIHVPIAGMSLVPVIMKWPLVLLPVHIVFLELIIDPACSVIFEAEGEEADIMSRPPRNPRDKLFNRHMIGLSILQGLSVFAIVLVVFWAARARGHSDADARALTFTTLVVANLSLIFTNRSWSRTIFSTLSRSNPALWWVTGGTLVLLPVLLYAPFLRNLFRFSTLHPLDLLVCLSAGVVSIVWFEVLKLVSGRRLTFDGASRA